MDSLTEHFNRQAYDNISLIPLGGKDRANAAAVAVFTVGQIGQMADEPVFRLGLVFIFRSHFTYSFCYEAAFIAASDKAATDAG